MSGWLEVLQLRRRDVTHGRILAPGRDALRRLGRVRLWLDVEIDVFHIAGTSREMQSAQAMAVMCFRGARCDRSELFLRHLRWLWAEAEGLSLVSTGFAAARLRAWRGRVGASGRGLSFLCHLRWLGAEERGSGGLRILRVALVRGFDTSRARRADGERIVVSLPPSVALGGGRGIGCGDGLHGLR